MLRKAILLSFSIVSIVSFTLPSFVFAQSQRTISAQSLLPKVQLSFGTRSGSFVEGSTFEIPVLLNTNGTSVNAVELHIKFDPRKLAIVKPSGDKSIIAIWLEPPTYSNTAGTAKLVGAIPNGITTKNGVVAGITFRAIESGTAVVNITQASKVLANDGQGTDLLTQFDRASFSIITQPPQGVRVFSETHPFDSQWYNNNNPVIGWETEAKISGFSYNFDNEPFTNPDNTSEGTSTVTSFENVEDGIWYFHIKAEKNKIWGATTHFLVRIDSTPPAAFTPVQGFQQAAAIGPTFVSFFTTDAASGIDHYEIGVIEKTASAGSAPIFVPAESPYQLPMKITDDVQVIVRAFDRAGNIQTGKTDIRLTFSVIGFLTDHSNEFVMGLFALILFLIIIHYIFKHNLFHHVRRTVSPFEYAERQVVPQVQTPMPKIPNYVLSGPHEDLLPPQPPH